MVQITRDKFLQEHFSRTQDSVRTNIVYLEELLKKFKFAKFIEKLNKKVKLKDSLFERFANRISQVDFKEFNTIMEPHNDYE